MSHHERETALLARVPDRLFIGGQWQDASGGATLTVRDPATGLAVRTIAAASPDDAQAAIDAAAAAAASWAATAPRVRGEVLRRTFDLLQERAMTLLS